MTNEKPPPRGEIWCSCQWSTGQAIFYSARIPTIEERRLLAERLEPFDLVQSDPARAPVLKGKHVSLIPAQVWKLCTRDP